MKCNQSIVHWRDKKVYEIMQYVSVGSVLEYALEQKNCFI